MPSHLKKAQQIEELKKHKGFLSKVKEFAVYRPKYDLMSLQNNLLLHRHYDPRQQLKPSREALKVTEIEREIRQKRKESAPKQEEQGEKWYQKVLAAEEPTQKRFNFTYKPTGLIGWGASSELKRVYRITSTNTETKRGVRAHSLYGSFRQ